MPSSAVLALGAGICSFFIELSRTRGVLPYAHLTPAPWRVPGLAGVLNYQGTPLAVVDLCLLQADRPSSPRMSTRIVLTHFRSPDRAVGLLAEDVRLVRLPSRTAPSPILHEGVLLRPFDPSSDIAPELLEACSRIAGIAGKEDR